MEVLPTFFNKPTAAVHIQNVYTASERKLLNVCLLKGSQDGFQSEQYYVDVWETLRLLGCEHSKNSDWLKNELFGALLSKILRWNVLRKDRTLEEWSCQLLSGLVYEPQEGKLAFQFNPNIVRQFQQHSLYSTLMLQIQAPIKSGHTLAIYEYLNDELHRSKAKVRSVLLPLDDLRSLLNISSNTYKQFKYFNSQVIKPAFLDVQKHTDIDASYETIKKVNTKTIVSINITAKRKQNFQLSIDLPSASNSARTSSNNSIQDDAIASGLVELLTKYGVTRNKAKLLVESNTAERIIDNLKYSLSKRGVKNLAPYLVKVIENNYSSGASLDKKESESKMEKDWHQYRLDQSEVRFRALSEDDRSHLKQKFIESIETSSDQRLTREKYRYEGGWESRWVQAEFQRKVMLKLLETPEETDFKVFKELWPKREIQNMLIKVKKESQ